MCALKEWCGSDIGKSQCSYPFDEEIQWKTETILKVTADFFGCD